MGETGVDVKLSEEGVKHFPYSVECKCVESVNLWASWKQATENAEPNTTPVLLIKRSRTPAIAVVDADYFFSLVSK